MGHQITLVLGAGASIPYGYPSGTKLVEDICNFSGKPFIQQESEKEKIKKALTELKLAQTDSIDQFLAYHKNLSDTLRPYMTMQIIKYESEDKLFILGQNHWYKHFFNPLISNDAVKTKLNLREIKIVTFNYDRSLEFFVFNMIKARGQFDDSTTLNIYNELKIIHVYGRVPKFHAEVAPMESAPYTLEYQIKGDPQEKLTYKAVKLYTESEIGICYENCKKTQEIEAIIGASRNVLFLGFGFHELNFKALGYDFIGEDKKKIFATCFGIGNKQQTFLEAKYKAIKFLSKDINSLLTQNYAFKDGKTHYLEI